MDKLVHLRRVVLEQVNRLECLNGVSLAPNIESVVVMGADSLQPKAFECLVTKSTVKGILPGIGLMNSSKYKEALDLIPESMIMNGFYGTENQEFSFV
jgi:hypothetical protein